MVGNKGKVTRSKQRALKPEPSKPEPEPELLESSLESSALVLSDGKNGQDGISISENPEFPMALEQKHVVEEPSGFIVSDGNEEKNPFEDNDYENNIVTETDVDLTEEVNDGVGVDGITNMTDDDFEEIVNSDNPKEDQVEEEPPLKIDHNEVNNGDEREVTTENVSTNNEGLNSNNCFMESATINLENHNEPSGVDPEVPPGTTSDLKEEENANVSDEAKVVRPKKKVVKKKLVKKLVKKNAVNKEIPQPSDENDGVEADNHINIEEKESHLYNEQKGNEEDIEAKVEVKPSVMVNKKRNRNRKKKALEGKTVQDPQKNQNENDKSESKDKVEINEAEENSGAKEKKMAKKGSNEVGPKDVKKPKKGKSGKKAESMGMIFMCNKETKKDCYKYNILGLPAGKKEMVLKIYKGMRLFLFDVDLRLMYGIYKAASPGGYNIEPSAFKSQFPSQVRFSVLKDCVPLAEERFRKVLKDNYFSKKKFSFELNNEQVKNLCKLFEENSKKAESTKAAISTQRASAPSSSVRRDKKKRKRDEARRPPPPSSSARRDEKRRRVEESRRPAAPPRAPPLARERFPGISHEEIRLAPVVITDRYHERPTYERDPYVHSVAPVPIYQPIIEHPRSPPRRTYSYDRVSGSGSGLGLDPYRRETVIDPRDLAPSSRGSRVPIERAQYDSYVTYREAPRAYSGQTYSSGTRREHYDYGTSDGQYSEYHRSSDYRPSLPLYRRY